jgi:transcription termination factor Rho
MGRAFNAQQGNSGRTMTGGLDTRALEVPKRVFGAARKAEEGGSLTIVASALVDTGSKMDEFIFQEFKGTGNMELVLDRGLSNRRTFPAIDLNKSGTRREDLLLGPDVMQRSWTMRRMYLQMVSSPPQGAGMDPSVATEALLQRLARTKNNQEFLDTLTDSL